MSSWSGLAQGDAMWKGWEDARKLYDSGQFQEALISLTRDPQNTPEYHYNAGTIYFRLKEYGKARAELERADRLAPYQSDIAHNLRLTRDEIARQIGRDRLDPASTSLERIADETTMDQVRACLGLVVFVAVMLWVRPYRRTRSLRKTLLQPSGWVGAAALVLMLALFAARQAADSNPPAIAVETRIIRSGPGDHYLQLSELATGMKVRFTGSRAQVDSGRWIQIRYAQDAVGWIPESSVLLL